MRKENIFHPYKFHPMPSNAKGGINITEVRIFPHYRELRCIDPQRYPARLQALCDDLFAVEPWGNMATQMALRASLPPAGVAPSAALEGLKSTDLERPAARELERLTTLADPATGTMDCHLFPCLDPQFRGGFTYAPGKMLLAVPVAGEWEKWLVQNITHEFSHTLRMRCWPLDERHGFGPAFRYTIREHLVFEGLAESLVQQFHSDSVFPLPLASPDDQQRFWAAIQPHVELENWAAYRVLMNPAPNLPKRIGYTVGCQLVQSFLHLHNTTALAAHALPYATIYENSEYPLRI